MYLAVDYHWCCKIDAMHISNTYWTSDIIFLWVYMYHLKDTALNILFKFACRLRNVLKIKKIEHSHDETEKYIH